MSAPLGTVLELAGRLSNATDDVTRRLAKAEALLGKTRLGVTAEVDMTTAEDEEHNQEVRLSYKKVGADWRLFATIVDRNRFDDAEDHVLLKASKALRMRAATAMAALLDAMIVEAERQVVQAEAASAVLDDVFGRFEGLGDDATTELDDDFNSVSVTPTDDIPF